MAGVMSNSQVPNATAHGELLLAKYLTDSIRSLEHAIRKSAPIGPTVGNLPRSLSAPRLDLRKFPAAQAPVAAAVLAASRRDDFGHTLGGQGRSGGQVVATQARLLHPNQPGYSSPSQQQPMPRPHGGTSGLPPKPSAAATAAASLPPRPTAVVRTAHAIAAALQQQQQQQASYGRAGGGGTGGMRSTSAPRLDDSTVGQHLQQQEHHQHHHGYHNPKNGRTVPSGLAGQLRYGPQSEARVPAVAAAPPLPGFAGGAGAVPMDARSAASVRRSAPSDAGTHSSWWQWRPVTDASYPLTAITDRYAQSMSPSEVVKWNDRVARLEAEINQEKARRKQFEEQLKKLQHGTTSSAPAPGGGKGFSSGAAATAAGGGGGKSASKGVGAGPHAGAHR